MHLNFFLNTPQIIVIHELCVVRVFKEINDVSSVFHIVLTLLFYFRITIL